MQLKMEQKKVEMKEIERDNLTSIKQQLLNMANRTKYMTMPQDQKPQETQQEQFTSPINYPPTTQDRSDSRRTQQPPSQNDNVNNIMHSPLKMG